MKFSIAIPTLNRFDLLLPSLIMYVKQFENVHIYIIDNGKQNCRFGFTSGEAKNLFVFENEKNIGVAASWNMACDMIFENSDYALILNDDIYLGKSERDIEQLIKKRPNHFMRATPDWCAFILPKSVYQKVGKFDECFYPAYYEDRSYEWRMKLMGIPSVKTPELNPMLYRSSQTLEKMPSILEDSKRNKKLYIEMWGGEPEREKFKKPYNEK